MAAPSSKTLKDLNGKWVMNKTLSDSTEPALALQGVGWFVRKGISVASVTLNVKQYTAAPKPPSTSPDEVVHVDIVQTATGGIKGTTELRCLDSVAREHSDWLFGKVSGRSRWVKRAEVADEYLKRGWIEEGEDEEHVESRAESVDNGWVALQIWGFQLIGGERRYTRNIVVSKGAEKVEMRLVYDWAGEQLDFEM
ncbi:hypothetical protein RB595_007307 [Gaeumannomyces hyphopodioides]